MRAVAEIEVKRVAIEINSANDDCSIVSIEGQGAVYFDVRSRCFSLPAKSVFELWIDRAGTRQSLGIATYSIACHILYHPPPSFFHSHPNSFSRIFICRLRPSSSAMHDCWKILFPRPQLDLRLE